MYTKLNVKVIDLCMWLTNQCKWINVHWIVFCNISLHWLV